MIYSPRSISFGFLLSEQIYFFVIYIFFCYIYVDVALSICSVKSLSRICHGATLCYDIIREDRFGYGTNYIAAFGSNVAYVA